MVKYRGSPFIDEKDKEHAVEDAKNIATSIALPVYEEIKYNNTVLNLDSVERYIQHASKIAVTDCSCRVKRKHCDSPLDVCLPLNDAANMLIGKGFAKEVSKTEALGIVRRAHDAGLVPMAGMRTDTPKPEGVNWICNCCSCCCGTIGVSLWLGKDVHMLKGLATTLTDSSKCNSCGACVDRCHFEARKIVGGRLVFDKDLCFGCGLCVDKCPSDAISLIHLQ
ncbi:MAG: 4Fe-4S binding protein [Candidatus Bathyarchaeia archaeon]|jgi:ferredoxin